VVRFTGDETRESRDLRAEDPKVADRTRTSRTSCGQAMGSGGSVVVPRANRSQSDEVVPIDIELRALLEERLKQPRKPVRRNRGRSTVPGGCYAYVPLLEPPRGPSV